MKRLALIVSAIAMTATAYAQDATEFKNSGEFRARYENYFNKSGQDNGQGEAHVDARLKYNLNIRKGEKLQANLGVVHSTRLGATPGNGPIEPQPETQGNYNTPSFNGLVVTRAWGWWRGTDAVSFKVGRFGIDIADGAVFSENDWEAVPFSHEGLNVAFDSSLAVFNLYAVKQAELGQKVGGGNSDMEQNYYMLTADLKNMPEVLKMANIHLIDVTRDSLGAGAGNGAKNWQHIGLTLGGDVAGFIYKATGAFQFGSFDKPDATIERKLSASMVDLMAGYGLPETMGLKVSVGYHMDSGDDGTADTQKGYQGLFYDRHNYAGLMDVVQWGNLSQINVNASIMPMEDLEAGAGFYLFSRSTNSGSIVTGDAYSTPNAVVPAAALQSGQSAIGNEIDVFANKAYGPDLKIGARYSMFMPGSALSGGTANVSKNAHMGYLQASMGF